jgi:hypothetical protein
MPIGYFIVPYDVATSQRGDFRQCAMMRFNAQIEADNPGATTQNWSEIETMIGYALVRVRASATTLTTIGAETGFTRLPAWMLNLDATLGSLTTTQRTAVLNKLDEMGFTLAEIQAVFGTTLANWRTRTFRQLLNFVTGRRVENRYDADTHQFVYDGAFVSCPKSVDDMVSEVPE